MTLETETLSGGQANQAGINLELFRLVSPVLELGFEVEVKQERQQAIFHSSSPVLVGCGNQQAVKGQGPKNLPLTGASGNYPDIPVRRN